VKELKNPPFRLVRQGPVFWPYFDLDGAIPTRAEAITETAVKGFKSRYQKWLDMGIYLPPSAYEVGFLSSAHTKEQVRTLVKALAEA